jgi:hypothetical protein
MEVHMRRIHGLVMVVVLNVVMAGGVGAAAQAKPPAKAPAPLAGRWEGTRTGEGGQTEPVALVFDVKDKTFTGVMYRSGREFGKIENGKIDGAKIVFQVQGIDFAGAIDGTVMTVTILFDNATQEFTVTKKATDAHRE